MSSFTLGMGQLLKHEISKGSIRFGHNDDGAGPGAFGLLNDPSTQHLFQVCLRSSVTGFWDLVGLLLYHSSRWHLDVG